MDSASPPRRGLRLIGRCLGRALVSAMIGLILLMLTQMTADRGFLPSHRCYHILDFASADDSNGSFVRVDTVEAIEYPPPMPAQETTRVIIQENSMGRTDSGGLSGWRASNWTLLHVIEGDRIRSYETGLPRLQELGRLASLEQFVRQKLIPESRAMSYWPGAIAEPIAREERGWSVRQGRRTLVGRLIGTLAVCMTLGFIVSLVVLPIRLGSPNEG